MYYESNGSKLLIERYILFSYGFYLDTEITKGLLSFVRP